MKDAPCQSGWSRYVPRNHSDSPLSCGHDRLYGLKLPFGFPNNILVIPFHFEKVAFHSDNSNFILFRENCQLCFRGLGLSALRMDSGCYFMFLALNNNDKYTDPVAALTHRTAIGVRAYGKWRAGVRQLQYGRTATAIRSQNDINKDGKSKDRLILPLSADHRKQRRFPREAAHWPRRAIRYDAWCA